MSPLTGPVASHWQALRPLRWQSAVADGATITRRLGEIEALLRGALVGLHRVLGHAHPDTRAACSSHFCFLTALCRAREARELQAQYGGGMVPPACK